MRYHCVPGHPAAGIGTLGSDPRAPFGSRKGSPAAGGRGNVPYGVRSMRVVAAPWATGTAMASKPGGPPTAGALRLKP